MNVFTTFAKQSMINRLSNPINRNRSAAQISKVMSSTGDPPPVAKSILLIFLHTSIDTILRILSILHFLCTSMCIVWQLGAEQVDCTSCIISLRVPRLSILYAYEAGNKCMIISLCIFYPFRILHLRPVCRVHCSATSATREQVDCTGCPKKNALSELCGICVRTKFFGYFGYFEQASLQPSF